MQTNELIPRELITKSEHYKDFTYYFLHFVNKVSRLRPLKDCNVVRLFT